MTYDLAGKRVFIAGHAGLVGSALTKRLVAEGCEILTAGRDVLDLTDQRQTFEWVAREQPQAIFMAAAKVGGILANDRHPAQFLYNNLVMQANVVEAARLSGVEKLMMMSSSVIYPKFTMQPISEAALLTGDLEPTCKPSAVAKIAGVILVDAYRREYDCDFITAVSTNMYGAQDNFDIETSHVVPALIRKAHEAKLANAESMTVWGSGTPLREFLFVDDCADALVFLMQKYSDFGHINVGG